MFITVRLLDCYIVSSTGWKYCVIRLLLVLLLVGGGGGGCPVLLLLRSGNLDLGFSAMFSFTQSLSPALKFSSLVSRLRGMVGQHVDQGLSPVDKALLC